MMDFKRVYHKLNVNNTCWPVERCKLLKKSYEAYCNNDNLTSIFYECEALSLSFLNENDHVKDTKNIKNNATKEKSPTKVTNKLLTYIENALNDAQIGIEDVCFEDDDTVDAMEEELYDVKQGIQDLIENYSALPNEWTVVQACKINTVYRGFATSKQSFIEPNPIKFTLFRYPQSHKLSDEPLCCHLDVNKAPNLFEDLYHLYFDSFKDLYESTKAYTEVVKTISNALAKVIEKLKLWLGPWVVLFSGKIKGEQGQKFELEIYQKVDAFSAINQLTMRQNVLLSLVARRLDLINSFDIENVSNAISKTNKQCDEIKLFLSNTKKNTNYSNQKYYPLILILDEHLDTIPWEMLIPDQETTRFNSVHMLFALYKEYKDRITDGYLKLELKTGSSLINPNNDTNLGGMVKRMSDFLAYWTPDWKSFQQKIPTDCEMREIISTTDMYVYAGHGSSFQYLNFEEIETLATKTVMLLFGCESAALTFNGWVSEASMFYMKLHAAKCPFILGALCVVTDLWTDIVSIMILSQWVPSDKMKVWKPTHVTGNLLIFGFFFDCQFC